VVALIEFPLAGVVDRFHFLQPGPASDDRIGVVGEQQIDEAGVRRRA